MKRIAICLVLMLGFGLALAQEPKIPDLADTKVTIPWTELKKLIEAGMKVDKDDVKPPVAYALSNAAYRGVVRGKTMTVTATCDLEVLKEKWAEVDLMYGAYSGAGFALRSATLDNKRAGIYSDGGWSKLAVRGPGSYTLTGVLREGRAGPAQDPGHDPDAQGPGRSVRLGGPGEGDQGHGRALAGRG